jgi:hypothetical protein
MRVAMADENVKQYQERLMAECLQRERHLGIANIEAGQPPSTDVLLTLETGQVVALEVRGLTDPSLRESISTKHRVGRIAEAALEGWRVNAHVAWESGAVVPARDAPGLGEELARTVRTMIADGMTSLGELDEVPNPLRPYVAALHLFPPESDGARVHVTMESWNGSASTKVVQDALDAKQARLAGYRRAHPDTAIWLLLWTSAGESQPVTTEMLDPNQVYRSGFDRAFILDYPRRAVLELRLEPGPKHG